jgi:hypothetical protein
MGLQRWTEILVNDSTISINKLNVVIDIILEINDEFLKKTIKTQYQ